MDETNRNSMKLDIDKRMQEQDLPIKKEVYKKLDSFEDVPIDGVKNSNMVREKVDIDQDGADEKMLGSDDQSLVAKKDEVKFISGGDQLNGDAKIDIGIIDKSFTGMSKDELMKFANDPFWIKLRWVLFVLFWALWVAMLVGAILIIVNAPKCEAPVPLVWWKQGPLVTIKSGEPIDVDIAKAEKLGVKGVIYELPGDETYFVDDADIQERIKKLVDAYSAKNIKVIMDIVPNYVTEKDELFLRARANNTFRSPFIWRESSAPPTNWLSTTINSSAWYEIDPGNYVLSQFGYNRYDLQMKDPIAKEKFKNVLIHLTNLGVKGFRLVNAKNLIIDQIQDELVAEINKKKDSVLTDYNFWTHTQTVLVDGLGELINEFKLLVHNKTNNDGFLSVTQDIERPDIFTTKSKIFGIDLPLYGQLPQYLAENSNASKLYEELNNTYSEVGDHSWMQWELTDPGQLQLISLSAYNMFLSLLPGVSVFSLDEIGLNEDDINEYTELNKIRNSPSYMHGSFNYYQNGSVIAYTRVKSGNPGYLVVYNPSDEQFVANFRDVKGMATELTVNLLSNKLNITDVVAIRSKIQSNAIPVLPRSAVILTYVYKSS